MVAGQDGIEVLDFATGRCTPFANPEPDMAENRLNDAKVDGDGAIWVGSMRLDAGAAAGSLYCIDGAGRSVRMESGITVSNGLGWSPDGGTFYFVDTIPGTIWAYPVVGGRLGARRVFAQIPEREGRPDGLCVDAEGHVWCAIWDGWRVDRFRPDGTLERSLHLPVPRPTSVCFGGEGLGTLFVTSARTRLPASALAEAPLSGGLFACEPGVAGLPATPFRPVS
jgi:sugar lactone lactonase YvrE